MTKQTGKTKQLSITIHSISPIATLVDSFEISKQEHLLQATSLLSQANKYLDSVIAYKEAKTKPITEALRLIRAETRPLETALETIIDTLKNKLSDYQTQALETQKQEELAISEALASGDLTATKALKALDKLPGAEKKVGVGVGSITFIEKEDVEVVDVALLAQATGAEYILPDIVKIRQALKNGVKLEGCRYFTSQIIRNNR